MFVSKAEIESLIIDLALSGNFERDGAHELLYHLRTPGANIPSCIAEIMIEHPEVCDRPSQLPQRIAFGLVDDALCRFDMEARKRRQQKVFRALNLVRLALQQQEFPDTSIQKSKEYHAVLVFAAEALQRLAEEEVIFPAEAPTLVEQLLQSHLQIQAVTELLLEIQIRRFAQRIRTRLKERVERAFEEGETRPASGDQAIMDLTEPIGFREGIKTHQDYPSSSAQLKSLFSSLC